MGMPRCSCIPPDGDDWTRPWLRECDHHKRMREALLAVALLDSTPSAVDLPDDLAREVQELAGGIEAVSAASAGPVE